MTCGQEPSEEGRKYPRKPYRDVDGSEEVAEAKLSLGSFPDAWAMLHTQERVTWFAGEVDKVQSSSFADTLLLAEGVETALSAALIYDRPAWAKCSGFPSTIILPECVQDVLICADHDQPGILKNGKLKITSERRAKVLAEFIIKTRRRCDVVMPQVEGDDFNDVLIAQMAAA